jgi:hypothetical protein
VHPQLGRPSATTDLNWAPLVAAMLESHTSLTGVVLGGQSCAPATTRCPPMVFHRAENSHQPTRRREGIMKRFKSRGRCSGLFPSMIRSPPPRSFIPPASKLSQCGMRSPAWPWPLNLARRPVDRRHSTHRAFRYSIDDKLTMPSFPPILVLFHDQSGPHLPAIATWEALLLLFLRHPGLRPNWSGS